MKEEFDVLTEMIAEIKQQNSEIKSQLSNRQESPNSESEKISEVQEAITAFARVYGEHLKKHAK